MAGGRLTGRAKERLAQLSQVLGCHSRAVIAHAHVDVFPFPIRPQLNRLARRVEALRVTQQVIHRALNHGGPACQAQPRLCRHLNPLLRCAQRRVFLQVMQQGVEVNVLGTGLIGVDPGQRQDFTDQGLQPVTFTGQAWP